MFAEIQMVVSENLKELTAAGAVMLVRDERGGHEGESSEVHRHIYRLQGSTFCLHADLSQITAARVKTSIGFTEELEDMLWTSASTSKRSMTAVVWTTGLKSPSFVIPAPQDRDYRCAPNRKRLYFYWKWVSAEQYVKGQRTIGTLETMQVRN